MYTIRCPEPNSVRKINWISLSLFFSSVKIHGKETFSKLSNLHRFLYRFMPYIRTSRTFFTIVGRSIRTVKLHSTQQSSPFVVNIDKGILREPWTKGNSHDIKSGARHEHRFVDDWGQRRRDDVGRPDWALHRALRVVGESPRFQKRHDRGRVTCCRGVKVRRVIIKVIIVIIRPGFRLPLGYNSMNRLFPLRGYDW